MKLLALDTSGEACSAALYLDGTSRQCLELAARRHGALILPMMQSLLDGAGIGLKALDAIAFGRGPGSFTGVRIAVAVAQGAAFGAGRPTVPVSTLAALAQGEFRRSGRRRLLAALDARMGEVYWGAYEVGVDGLAAARGAELVSAPGAVPVPAGEGWCGVGPGWERYCELLTRRVGAGLAQVSSDGVCEARDIALLAAAQARAGQLVPAELARPVYLRDRVTHVQISAPAAPSAPSSIGRLPHC
ncbi:tRNA (adenosine(37)-N6)-threonylcarbamoyltransferase complex dimerization subunit type 1 TsaB [uncultured Thiodictyon sp.]|jgi:tRNA threonylcarbamoyladenosine biosynthesis protein TsaB|uniref:tRNA (adenosine(37)-N6)-threonylcarbamoyltransferase complex dimerization subunit type 1 TsaB n=1 Tax=uncultured Thiodictyon sp. TaxID=1846217 RepID=UPI0025EEA491|nr:tRNA (adenosine(37)-N6)-threonylcarbamoyltransferase complex dimerization subunit type 1 TsaB [uncultured Thiodictyon sp.]